MYTILEQLTEMNYSGVAFLFSFGATWLICAAFWKLTTAKTAGYATLLQGLVALPIALTVSYLIGALSENPGGDLFTQLSITIAMSQMLILPLIIVMQAKEQHTLVPFVFSGSISIHFVMYAWMYQTWLYILMPVMIAVGIAFIYGTDKNGDQAYPTSKAAGRSCFLTGLTLVITGILLLII